MGVSQNGWPVNPARSRRRILSPASTVEITVVNGAGGDLLLWVIGQIDLRVEDVDLKSTRGEFDDWGWADRPIRNSSETSNHASATAGDVNATRHPLGRVGTFSPPQVYEIHRILAEAEHLVRWGGDYSGRRDEMHFELADGSTTARCAAVLARVLHTAPPGPPLPAGPSDTLQLGSRGPQVRRLQEILTTRYPAYARWSPVTDYFGVLTEAAVKEFQRRSGLEPDGIVGPLTRAALHF